MIGKIKAFILCIGAFAAADVMAAKPVAVWRNFEELATGTPLVPHFSIDADDVNCSEWRMNLAGGSVNKGVLSTGNTSAPYISFGTDNNNQAKVIDVGRTGHPFSVVVAIETPVEEHSGNPPYLHIGNGSTGIGLAYVSSEAVCGAWGNNVWNSDLTATIGALGLDGVTNLAFSISTKESENTAVAVVGPSSSQISWGAFTGLRGVGINATQINFGNYLSKTQNGLNYKVKSVAVFDTADRPSVDDLKVALMLMDSPPSEITRDITVGANYNDELGFVYIPSGVTVWIEDASKITSDTVICGSGTVVYKGFLPSSEKRRGLNTVFWSGKVKILNFEGSGSKGAAEFDIETLGSKYSVIEVENCMGWIAGSTTIEILRLEGEGLLFNNGSSTSRATVTINSLIGSGAFKGAATSQWMYGVIIKEMESFMGSIDLSSRESSKVCVLNGTDASKLASGSITIGKVAEVAEKATWTANDYINGYIKVLSEATVRGAGTIGSRLLFEAGAILDVTKGYLTVEHDVALPDNGIVMVKLAEDSGAEIAEPGVIIACRNADDLDLTKFVLSPEPNFRYVLKARAGKIVYERRSGLAIRIR